ncbi:MAG: SNF2-related protein, partial [Roseburia sp.]|nr:SNF2-related protein [Roseburia sp.]
MEYRPYYYQEFAEQFILDHAEAGLLLDMGMGKTAVSLTAADKLLNDYFAVRKILVIAPLKPARETWPPEVQKWDHLRHLRLSLILGSKAERLAALDHDADIYIINRENVVWLVDHFKSKWPFDMVIIDELSSFKSSKAQRFRALKKVRRYITRVVGLTGTPTPKGLLDLWPQMYLLDEGKALGKTLTGYRDTYF